LYLAAIEKWYRRDLPHPLRDYVHDREKSYNQIYQQIEFDKPQNPLIFAVCLWNAQLFFEFHEHLEDIWHSSKGKKRQALQGLIKAAGAYIHLEAGNHDAAQSLAKKSMQLISAHQAELAFISNLDALIAELESIHQPPPLLTITNVTRTK
jgi:predicted metal-dependent hydrolase